ncbi:eCIS core domain-containing protein [Streptomyces lavendulae]|uniref:eCIS core domain-containing protein n=1 Tax=Streptomyces lavendulae TaxID=1914 RepID=UPI0036814D2A
MAARELPAVPARPERRPERRSVWRAADPPVPEPDERLEAEADRFAERYATLAPGAVRPLPRPLAAASPTGDAGAPLDPATRAAMEPRLGWDLSRVRVHTGPAAAASAAALDARAYTAGGHIVLGDGARPGSDAGRRLLAHELAHVAQQARGEGAGRIHRKPLPPAAAAAGRRARGGGKPYKLLVKQEMNPAELLRHFVRQYYQTTDEREVERRLPWWHWDKPGGLAAGADDVRRGRIWLTVTDATQAALDRLPQEEQDRINAEADARFWRRSGLPEGTKLGRGPEDAVLRARWLGARADVTWEHAQLRELQALPEDVRRILFAGDRPLVPEDYEKALGLARRLTALTPAQRAAYLDRVNGSTGDWDELDASIGRFEDRERLREADAQRTEEAASALFGCEDLYRLWRARNTARQEAIQASPYTGYQPALVRGVAEAGARFEESLARHGFAGEQAFLDAMAVYRLRFRDEAVDLALRVLDHYDHLLYEERGRLRAPGHVASLVSGIAASGAPGLYARAAQAESTAQAVRTGADPESSFARNRDAARAAGYQQQAAELRNSAQRAVLSAGGGDPLLDPARLGRGTDLEKLSGLDEAGAREYLLGVLDARLADTARARHEFTGDPERVYSLPDLVRATKEHLGTDGGTVYGWIVDDHIEEVRRSHVFTAVVLGILALVLAALVPVGGWVAAIALIGTTSLSVYQAGQALQEYRTQSADYRLSFIEDEPSLLWVGVALAAAAVDLGVSAVVVFKASAKALSTLEGPLRELAAASDAESAAARYRTLVARIDEAEGLDQAVKEALKNRAAAARGLDLVAGEVRGTTMAFLGIPEPRLLRRGLFHLVRLGASTFTKLRKEKQLIDLLGDVTKLSGAARVELEAAFSEVKQIVSVGKARRMDEATLLEFVDRSAAARKAGGSSEFESIVADMRAWHPQMADQDAAEKVLVGAWDKLRSRQQTRDELLAELRAGPKTASGAPDLAKVKELEDSFNGLDDVVHHDRDGRTWVKQGLISKARQEVLAAEAAAETARVSPVKRMRAVFDGSRERAEVAASGTADRVGTLRSPSEKLAVDHVVSLDRMSQMEGFTKLKAVERELLAVRKDNLVLMDFSANSSKGPRSWSAWEYSSNYYTDPAQIAQWKARDAELTAKIQKWILDTVRGR